MSAADLHQDGAFWLSLSSQLRWEMAKLCHSHEVKTAPTNEVLGIQKINVNEYVGFVTHEYEQQDESSAIDIEEACEEAKDEILTEKFDQLIPAIRRGP